jgi:hypothetical protein
VRTHMCQFGTPWQKATSFLIWGPSSCPHLPVCKLCDGRCSYSGKRHLHLTGLQSSAFVMQQAQVYPKKLASYLAEVVLGT